VTSGDEHETMTHVRIAQLKAHLSEHLHRVRDGDTIEILDRDRPVARIVPIPEKEQDLIVRPASANWEDVATRSAAEPVDFGATDSVAWLLEDRER
jgi:prevent-host-death family protein